MAMISIAGICGILVVIAVVTVSLSAARRFGSSASRPPVAPGMTLNCPACGQATDAALAVCQHCDQEL